MSNCSSRTAWRAQCKTILLLGAPPCRVTTDWPPPAVLAGTRRPLTFPTPACQPLASAACRSSAPSTSSAASSPHLQQGTVSRLLLLNTACKSLNEVRYPTDRSCRPILQPGRGVWCWGHLCFPPSNDNPKKAAPSCSGEKQVKARL